MKYVRKLIAAAIILCLLLTLSACGDRQAVFGSGDSDIDRQTVPGTEDSGIGRTIASESREEGSGGLTIVTDFYPENGSAPDGSQEEARYIYERIYRYAEYTGSGVQLMRWSTEYLSGRLLYQVSNPRIARSVEELGGPADGFSRSFCQHGPDDADLPPAWIRADGSFENHQVLLVDVTVTNEDAELAPDLDKYGNARDPYTFSVDGLLYLHNGSLKPPKEQGNFSYISYFSAKGDDPDTAFSFRLLPGETADFTLGFVIGKAPARFDSLEGLYLCNTMSADTILMEMRLED